jgi:orotate phosphoribosyltransferase
VLNYRSFGDLSRDIVKWLETLPHDFDLIVGIPRSGMMVANLIALYLDRPFTDIDSFLEGRILNAGSNRYKGPAPKELLNEKRKVLIVDDSSCTGASILEARNMVKRKDFEHDVYFGATYVLEESKDNFDFYYTVLNLPRVFEWNVFNHPILNKSCVDIDGLLCRDPTEVENDDGARYVIFLEEITPKILPKAKIGWLVTCRLEKYREQTETWLRRYNIEYENLVMMNFASKEERVRAGSHAKFKGNVYRKTSALLFIESSLSQAGEIARVSGKDVLCMENHEIINPALINRKLSRVEYLLHLIISNPFEAFRKIRRRIGLGTND